MWFALSFIALLMWSGSEIFSKFGCADGRDRQAHLKMLIAVGLVMGLHAAYSIFIDQINFSWQTIWVYLPVSLLYIFSMAIGYLGLRYIELSISSPICNTSGAIVMLIYLCRGIVPNTGGLAALTLVVVGILLLGYAEYIEDPELRAARQAKSNWQYSKSILAIAIPIAYTLIDALGTYADSLVLQELNEKEANTAYELTFCLVGLACFIFLLATRNLKFNRQTDPAKLLGACLETTGQFAYIFAIKENAVLAAPMISSYCVMSVIWSAIFLKERLSAKHYAAILTTLLGIILLGIYGE